MGFQTLHQRLQTVQEEKGLYMHALSYFFYNIENQVFCAHKEAYFSQVTLGPQHAQDMASQPRRTALSIETNRSNAYQIRNLEHLFSFLFAAQRHDSTIDLLMKSL